MPVLRHDRNQENILAKSLMENKFYPQMVVVFWFCLIFALTLCLPVRSADNLGKQFGPKIRPDESSGLISVQTV